MNNLSGAVNNVITSMAAQTGWSGAASFLPTWTAAPGSLISGQSPNSVGAGSFNQGGAGSVTVLTDGIIGPLNSVPGNGSSPNEVDAGTAASGAGQSVIYLLSGSATGYSLTNITVYGGWGDGGRDQQAYTVYYSKVGTPMSFTQLISVNYNPSNPSGSLSATRAMLAPGSGALATNVAAVKFDFTNPAGKNGYEGYSEIGIFGSATPNIPQVTMTAPAGNSASTAPAAVNLAAAVAANNNLINQVNFYSNGTNLIAQVNSFPYTYAWNNVGAGTYGVNAQVIYNNGYSLTSSIVAFTVTNPPPPNAPLNLTAATTNTQVMLAWSASASATSYNVKYAMTNGGAYSVVTNVAGTNFINTGLTAGMTYFYVVSALNLGGESSNSLQVSATPEALPPPWLGADIGGVGFAGIASYFNGLFTATGSGSDIAGSADAFTYVYQTINGNCDLRARVTSVQNTSVGAKAGLMLRENLANNSANAVLDVTPGNGLEFIWRSNVGGTSTAVSVGNTMAPCWVRLVRNKNTLTAYAGTDGTNWTKMGVSQNIPMTSTIDAGFIVCAQNNAALSTATFDNVTMAPPPGDSYIAPQLTASGQVPGLFTLQFAGVSDLIYTVQSSTNLTDWTDVFTNALIDSDAGSFIYTDSNAVEPANFYRVTQ